MDSPPEAAGNDDRRSLPELLRSIAAIPGIRWIRLMYMHPVSFTEALLDVFAEQPDKFPYLDMPLQHIDTAMLAAMQRKTNEPGLRALLQRIRARVPTLSLRTTFIVGFPGETEGDYQKTRALVEQVQFDNAFVFRYSPRTETPAAEMAQQFDEEVKEARNRDLLKVVDTAAKRAGERLVGREVEILCEGPSKTNHLRLTGRTRSNKIVVFEGAENDIGQLIDLKITHSTGFSLSAVKTEAASSCHLLPMEELLPPVMTAS